MKASDLLIHCLEAEGVDHLFGVPGEENLDVLESLSRSSIKLIITHHEQAAGFMAATYGRLTGNAGVCLATLGPGATNLVTAAAYAQLGAMPMLMITGQKPIKRSKQAQFQILDVVDMMQPLTKYTKQIASAETLAASVREAFRQAQEERPGAVHLELPEDIAKEESESFPIEASLYRRPNAEGKAIAAAVEEIAKAKHPLLLIGAGANRSLAAEQLLEFVERQQLPFVTTQMGKGVVSDEHPLAIGTAALSDKDLVHLAIEAADLIINIGHDVVEKPPFFMKPGGVRVVHVNFNAAKIDPVYFPQVEVVGDIAHSVAEINARLERQSCWDCQYFERVREAIQKHIGTFSEAPGFPIDPRRLVHDVRKAMPDDGILTLDNGLYKLWFARNYAARCPNTILLDNALATMGAGLPSAIAAKLTRPDQLVMTICGDGGFMMNAQELETAVRLKLSLVVVILVDNAFGMIKWKQASDGLHDYGLDFTNPDFVALARAHGAFGRHVASSDDLLPSLTLALEEGGVQIVEVPMDYSQCVEALGAELQELTENVGLRSDPRH
ncbi:MAG: acetolactate synthase-1/2/3 large subunit [Verrucomicrobiales bacterium]|jgi:acetolactate synthase-1/2/3 large subunit